MEKVEGRPMVPPGGSIDANSFFSQYSAYEDRHIPDLSLRSRQDKSPRRSGQGEPIIPEIVADEILPPEPDAES